MGFNLSKEIAGTLVQAPLASAGGDLASNYVDMQGFDGVLFVGNLGTAGSTDVATLAAWDSTATGSTGTAISGATQTSTASKSDSFFMLDVYRPRKRFVKTHFTRSAAVEYGGTMAYRYGPRVRPTVHSSTTAVSTGTPSVLTVPQTT